MVSLKIYGEVVLMATLLIISSRQIYVDTRISITFELELTWGLCGLSDSRQYQDVVETGVAHCSICSWMLIWNKFSEMIIQNRVNFYDRSPKWRKNWGRRNVSIFGLFFTSVLMWSKLAGISVENSKLLWIEEVVRVSENILTAAYNFNEFKI